MEKLEELKELINEYKIIENNLATCEQYILKKRIISVQLRAIRKMIKTTNDKLESIANILLD